MIHADNYPDARIIRVARAGGLAVTRKGGQLVALCPFHAERSPSMVLRPRLDAYHCFSCRASGGYVDLAKALSVTLDDVLGPHAPAPPSKPPQPIAPKRLDRAAVVNLWSSCKPVTSDAAVCEWLRSRRFDPALVEDRDLCRALPRDLPLPSWARCERVAWNAAPEQFRAIFPFFSAQGRLEGLRARALQPSEKKSLAPIGGGANGLVLADDLGRRVLAGDPAALAYLTRCAPQAALVIGEGETDFLRWATNWGDGADYYPAVWSVVAGSWTPELAARVPDGIKLTIATDLDEAGDKYAADIIETLRTRPAVQVWRWRPKAVRS